MRMNPINMGLATQLHYKFIVVIEVQGALINAGRVTLIQMKREQRESLFAAKTSWNKGKGLNEDTGSCFTDLLGSCSCTLCVIVVIATHRLYRVD